jgi:hypothetical protein
VPKVRITIDVTYDDGAEESLADSIERWLSLELLMNPESHPMQMAAGRGWVMSAHSDSIKETNGT